MRPAAQLSNSRFFVSAYLAAVAMLATAIVGRAAAVQTKVARSDTYEELSPGQLHSVSLSDQGRLTLAPELKALYRPDVEIIWSMVVAPDGRVFYGTGHEGKILVTDHKGSGTLHLDTDSPEVTALLFHPDGKLYVGTSPDGKLWVCDKPGTVTLVYETGEKYVWDLLSDPEGKILAATGPKGKIFRVDPARTRGEVLFDAPDENVLGLCYDPQGRLHAATQGKGRVYRWDDDHRTTPVVLFEAPDDEVRQIAVDSAGNIFAAVNSEGVSRRVVSPLTALLTRPSGASESEEGKGPEAPPSGPRALTPSTPAGKSEVHLIDKQGFVRSLWKATEAPIHDMVYDAGRDGVLIAAGSKGKIFRLDTRGDYWIVSSVEEEQVFALEPAGKQVYLATVGPTVAYQLGEKQAREGEYLSSAFDAEASVRWGTLRREGDGAKEIEIETRAGNTKEPDGTWYNWEAVKWRDGPSDGQIQSPVARYLQWRARFKATRGQSEPELDLVEIFFGPANEAPQVEKINIKKASPPRPPASPSKPATNASRTKPKKPGVGGDDLEVPEYSNLRKFEISWQVNDPNDDSLASALYFKGEDEKTWKLIKDELTEEKFVFETATLPDGIYRLKVVVSDRPSNFGPNVRQDELVSDQFIVDNTPPSIEKLKGSPLRDAKGKWHVTARLTDSTSLIAGAKYNINGQEWRVLVPTDGLFDERNESLEFDTETLKGDEHVLGLVVTDREGNSAVDKVVLRP